MTSTVIQLDSVSKRFTLRHEGVKSFQETLVNLLHRRNGSSEEFWALRDVSIDVQRGETLGIIGENGSGKSTILKLITHILEPTSGKITVDGKVSALIELGAGFHPDLTGRENIFLNGSILGFSREEMSRKVNDIVAFSELERFIDTPIRHYSSGMYTRLGFSVAISVDPDILIIDEVLAVGDEAFQAKCLTKIGEFRAMGKTIIFVSHGLPAVEALCDRVIWLHHGQIKHQGPAAETVHQYLNQVRAPSQPRAVWSSIATATTAGKPSLAVVDLRLLNSDHQEQPTYRSGELLVARLHCRVGSLDREAAFGMEIRQGDGLLVHRTSPMDSPRIVETGDQIVELEYPGLALAPGVYEVRPGLWFTDLPQPEWVPSRHTSGLVVWSECSQPGLVALPHRWLADESYGISQRSPVLDEVLQP